MNLLIETLNLWGERAVSFAWPMLWQSSVLIALLFAFDFAFRRKIRAAVRYALWLVVLVKLLLPPSLALPTSFAWWVRPSAPPPKAQERTTVFVVTYSDVVPAKHPTPAAPVIVLPPPTPSLSRAGWVVGSWAVVGAGLIAWMLMRWREVARDVRRATAAPTWLNELLDEARRSIKLSRSLQLRLTPRAMSPAVCGLFRPVILLPHSLVDRLTPAQLRAVLLHELVHLRRGDVWVNCAQTLLQIFYWWHPLLWLANARIRRVREEAVDDAVMLALRDDAEAYAPTLLEVAKLAFNRPLASLGLVRIMESRSALRQRIERLVDFRPPRQAGLTIVSALCTLAFAALAVPMEQAPPTSEKPSSTKDKSDSSGRTSAIPISSNSASSKTNAAELVQDGRLLLEAGKLDEAESKLREAIVIDPENRAAFYYRFLVKDARYAKTNAESLRRPAPYARTNRISKARQAILSKLDRIRMDFVSFDNLPLWDVVQWLNDEARNRDPQTLGINFIINPPVEPPARRRIDVTTGLPLPEAEPLDVKPLPITINPPLTDVRLADVLDAIVKGADNRIKYSIEDYAVVFSPKTAGEPAPLFTRTFRVDPKTFYKRLESVSGISFRDIESGGDQGILTLPGVTPPREPDGREPGDTLPVRPQNGGLRYIIRTNNMQAVSISVRRFFASLGVDLNPALGKTVFSHGRDGTLLVRATKQDLDSIEVGIQSLMAAPDRNIEAERQAVLSSTNDSFTPTPPKNAQPTATATNAVLDTRLYKFVAPVFLKNLQRQISESPDAPIQQIITNFLASAGVNLQPPSVLVFNEHNGTLLVRASLPQQELVEHLVQQLNWSPPQINIKVRFVEITQEDNRAVGFDWYLGNLLMSNGVAEIHHAAPVVAGVTGGQGAQLQANRAFTNSPGKSSSQLHGILTDPQFRVVLRALEQRAGVDILFGPEVTTTSGRQAQLQSVELRTVVTGINPQAFVSPGSISTNGVTNSLLQTQVMPFGPVLDVIPTISADGYTINLTVIPTVTEFLGYDENTNFVAVYINGKKEENVALSLPRFRMRQMTVNANVRDGHTLVLGNPRDQLISKKPTGVDEVTEFPDTKKKSLLIFVTPTLVDSAGKRIHSDDEPASKKK